MRKPGRLMLRRAIAITAAAVALSAAGAMAFVPGVSRASRVWSHSILSSVRGFTPVPAHGDSMSMAADPLLQNDAAPGTYCPIPPRKGTTGSGVTSSPHVPSEPLNAGGSTPVPGKTDLLSEPARGMCNVSTPATPVPAPILP